MENINAISAAIIAGGKSARFGIPKVTAVYQNKRLIDWAVLLAENITSHIVIVSGPEEIKYFDHIRSVRDKVIDRGPIGGIYTALEFFPDEWVAVLPCDMPRLSAKVYHYMMKFRSDNQPVVAKSAKGLEPLVSLWPGNALSTVEKSILEGNYSLHKLLSRLNAVQVDIPEEMPDYKPEYFYNINTQDDLMKLTQKDEIHDPT
ncbi:MAG: molybdenum cofactor guanylyltransferase [Calditrichaceae bacterium]